jgi:hypothetical protein
VHPLRRDRDGFASKRRSIGALRGERSSRASTIKSSSRPFDKLAREARGTEDRASAERCVHLQAAS